MEEKKILTAYTEAKKNAYYWHNDIENADKFKDSDVIKKQDAIECAYYIGRAIMLNQILQNDFHNVTIEKDLKELNELKSKLLSILKEA